MLHADETAVICDLAETYHVLDYRALPLKTVAALASGLREDSRIRMKLSGMKATTDTMLAAATVDRLSMLVWAKTKDGERGWNKPESILEKLTADSREEEFVTYDTPEEFMQARKALLGEGG
ncbi:MAG: hypothetical protein IJ088_02500 [Clostridia bacterium]|nr:hypothetical protein [Clostridia bacterium]